MVELNPGPAVGSLSLRTTAAQVGYSHMKKDELKALCRSRQLRVGGNKPDLIKRLEADDGTTSEPRTQRKKLRFSGLKCEPVKRLETDDGVTSEADTPESTPEPVMEVLDPAPVSNPIDDPGPGPEDDPLNQTGVDITIMAIPDDDSPDGASCYDQIYDGRDLNGWSPTETQIFMIRNGFLPSGASQLVGSPPRSQWSPPLQTAPSALTEVPARIGTPPSPYGTALTGNGGSAALPERAGLPTASYYQVAIFHHVDQALQRFGSQPVHLMVEAVAGSGKTTTVVAAASLVPADKSAIFLAFNKEIKLELDGRLPSKVINMRQAFLVISCALQFVISVRSSL